MILLYVLIVAALSANPLLSIAAMALLPLFARLTWRRAEPPLLFLALVAQWVGVAAVVFHAGLLNIDVARMSGAAQVEKAVWLGLVGLVTAAVGMRLGLRGLKDGSRPGRGASAVDRFSSGRVAAFYWASFVTGIAAKGLMWTNPRFSQILVAAQSVRWVFFFLLAYLAVSKRGARYHLVVAFAVEMLLGMTSFFAEFKHPFFVLIVAFLSVGWRLTTRRLAAVAGLAIGALTLGVLWSSVKEEYRDFINGGSGHQVIVVPLASRLEKIVELYGDLGVDSIGDGLERFAARMAYTEMFAFVLENVPATLPYEGGRLTAGAVQHVLMPRFLFPNKAAVDQTELASQYTGLFFAGDTAVSLGYMVELYVDFGPLGMVVATLVLGYVLGRVYRFFGSEPDNRLLGLVLAIPVIGCANAFEIGLTNLLGSLVMNFLVMAAFLKFTGERAIGWLERA
jgi:hypothetical protein